MFLTFCWFWWFQVPLGTSIWRSLEVSRHHFEGFWGYWKIIGISLDSMVWLAGSRIQRPWSVEGKSFIPGCTTTSKQPTCRLQYEVFQDCNLQDLKFGKDLKIAIYKSANFERNWRLQNLNLEKLCLTARWPPRRPADMVRLAVSSNKYVF